MNAKEFKRHIVGAMLFYGAALVFGLALGACDPPTKDDPFSWYSIWKDSQPLIVAIPAAWLGYCFQRRQAYLKDVRELSSKVVPAVQGAIQYTYNPNPKWEDFSKVMQQLSSAIDESRAVFSNLGEKAGKGGFFPLGSLVEIHSCILPLASAGNDSAVSNKVRNTITALWKSRLRPALLRELPRGVPEFPDSVYGK